MPQTQRRLSLRATASFKEADITVVFIICLYALLLWSVHPRKVAFDMWKRVKQPLAFSQWIQLPSRAETSFSNSLFGNKGTDSIQLPTISYHLLLIHVTDPLLSDSGTCFVCVVLCAFPRGQGWSISGSHWQPPHLWLICPIGRLLEQLIALDGFVFAIGNWNICRQTISEDNSCAFFLTMRKNTVSFTSVSTAHSPVVI